MNTPPEPRNNDPEIGSPETEGVQVSLDPGSPYLITVQMEPEYEGVLDADRLHKLAIGVLEAEGVQGPVEVGIVVTTDAEVLALNQQYLGHDWQTDVLSFGMADEGVEEFVIPGERPAYLGDVAISYDRAAEQAPDYGHSTPDEVATLLIHGLLHLLGYSDTGDEEREKMHSRQNELFAQLYHASEGNAQT